MTLKEALDSGYCSLEDDIDFDDTPQGEKIACLKLEIERLNNIINELEKWLEEDLKQVYRDAGYRHNLILKVLDKLQELKGSDSNE